MKYFKILCIILFVTIAAIDCNKQFTYKCTRSTTIQLTSVGMGGLVTNWNPYWITFCGVEAPTNISKCYATDSNIDSLVGKLQLILLIQGISNNKNLYFICHNAWATNLHLVN